MSDPFRKVSDMKKRRGDSVATDRQHWLGGFIRETKRGKPVFVIEKRIGGVLFKISTRRHTEDAAMRELRKFEADPGGYDPTASPDGVVMTPELVMEYCDWMVLPPPAGRGNTHEWSLQVASFLRDWLRAFGGLDLRRVSATGHVKPALKSWSTSRPGRVVALKGFFSWMRKEKGTLKHHEDPMPDVRIPERQAAKETSTGARDVPFDRVQKVFRHLRVDVRDILLLLTGTGWHVSEVRRFAEHGEIRKDPTGKHLAVLVTFHKRREKAVAGLVHQEHVDAAKRLRAEQRILSGNTLAGLMRRACTDAGLDEGEFFGWGDMRHSVGTWAIEAGDDIRNVARAFNHESEKMLRRHYVRHAVPRATVSTRVLEG